MYIIPFGVAPLGTLTRHVHGQSTTGRVDDALARLVSCVGVSFVEEYLRINEIL